MFTSTANRTARWFACLAAALLLLASDSALAHHGSTHNWNTGDGLFQDASSWNPIGVPATTDTARFALNTNYTVTFDASPTNLGLQQTAGKVTFASSGGLRTYTLTGTGLAANNLSGGSLTLGTSTDPIDLAIEDRLSVNGGELHVLFGSQVTTNRLSNFGNGIATTGVINVSGQQSVFNVTSTSTFVNIGNTGGTAMLTYSDGAVGNFGGFISVGASSEASTNGTLNVLSGSTFGVGHVGIGTSAGTGTVTVAGTGSSLTQESSSTLIVGSTDAAHNPGTLNVLDGGIFTTGTGTITVNATGSINIGAGGNGGTFSANGDVNVNGGSITRTSGSFSLAAGRTITATNGAQIDLRAGTTLSPATTWKITNGGQVSMDDLFASQINIEVSGIQSTFTANTVARGTFPVGNAHVGNVHISDGGLFQVQSHEIAGTITVTGAGSTFITTDKLTLTTTPAALTSTLDITNGASVINEEFVAGPGLTTINVSGPTTTWNNGSAVLIGTPSSSLSITDGATVTSTTALLRGGVANVSGAGSSWSSSGVLRVGDAGFGHRHLNISDQALVSSATGSVHVGSSATISGAGSLWNNEFHFGVGGIVNVIDGGQIVSSFGDVMGTAVVDGAGSAWTVTTSDFRIDDSGLLTVSGGGRVNSRLSDVGFFVSGGDALVTGAGSVWEIDGNLGVGRQSTGELTIADGGMVTSNTAMVGTNANFTSSNTISGTVHVTGTDSIWVNHGLLNVGHGGLGTVNVRTGGQLESGAAAIGNAAGPIFGVFHASHGIVTVANPESQWTNSGALEVGHASLGSALLEVLNGGTVNSGADGVLVFATGLIDVDGGNFNAQSDVIVDGGRIERGATGIFALAPGKNVTIQNSGEIAFTGEHAIGSASGNTWTVSGGGLFSVTDELAVGAFSNHVGVLTVSGGEVSSGAGSLGVSSTSQGTATVAGTGSTWTNVAAVVVGEHGTGQLNIQDGGLVVSDGGVIGSKFGSSGSVIVDDDGSRWQNSGELLIGNAGNGTLTIAGEGEVIAEDVQMAGTPNAVANVSVSTGSNLTAMGGLFVAGEGTAFLHIMQGGLVENDADGFIGFATGASGFVAVTGPDATWSNQSDLYVGQEGDASLYIFDGGQVTNNNAYIGHQGGSSGEVAVGGTGSTWTTGQSLHVGGGTAAAGGTGTLDVLAGGTVTINDTLIIWDDGIVNLFGGTLVTDRIAMLGSTFNFALGTLRFTSNQTFVAGNDLANAIGNTPSITAGQHLIVDHVATLLTQITIDGGTLSAGQLVNAPLLNIQRGTFNLTNQAVNIETGGLFGDRLVLKSDVILNIVQGVTNRGLITGSGILGGPLVNAAEGEVRAAAGHAIASTGATAENSGEVRLLGGLVEFYGSLFNTLAGRITGRGVLIARSGLINQGHVALSSGVTDVYGDVVNDTGNAAVGVTVSGNADATFWGDVTNTSGLFRVSANSSATFFGSFAGAGISGPGDVYFEADITPGFSPGLAEFDGNVHFGPLAALQIEIAGTTRGTQYDALDVAGTAALDGTLAVSLLSGFMPDAGDVFEIITAASISGTFVSELLPALTGDLFWNLDYGANSVTLAVAAPGLPGDLNGDGAVNAADYVFWRKNALPQEQYDEWRTNFGNTLGSGSSATAAVPEPASAWLLLAALAAIVALPASRRRAAHRINP